MSSPGRPVSSPLSPAAVVGASFFCFRQLPDTPGWSTGKLSPKSSCGINVHGVHVAYVIPGGPGYNRVKKGDVNSKIDAQVVTSANILALLRGNDEPGSQVEIEVQGLRSAVVKKRADSLQLHLLFNIFGVLSDCKEEARAIKQDKILDNLTKVLEPHCIKLAEWLSFVETARKAKIAELLGQLRAAHSLASQQQQLCDDTEEKLRLHPHRVGRGTPATSASCFTRVSCAAHS